MVIKIWVSIGSDNGLLPGSNKPLPEPMLPYPIIESWDSLQSNFTRSAYELNLYNMCSEITVLKLLAHPPGANELMPSRCWQHEPVLLISGGPYGLPSYYPFWCMPPRVILIWQTCRKSISNIDLVRPCLSMTTSYVQSFPKFVQNMMLMCSVQNF